MVTSLETLELRDDHATSSVWLAPSRGGLVTRFNVAGREVLFLDETTLLDPTKNVRGGVPILFPSPGKLAGGRYARDGAHGALAQHGFARNLPWQVLAQSPSAATLRLDATEETRAQFPFDFSLTFRFSLQGSTLRLEQRYANPGSHSLPVAFGFHPYFRLPQAEKAAARIVTPATRAFDNFAQTAVTVQAPIDLTATEVDLHLIDHGGTTATLALGDGHRIELRGSSQLRRWVIWTQAGKDFVCLEPWSAPADALNSGEGLLTVPPGDAVEAWLELAFC